MAEEDKRGVVFRPSFYEAIEPLPDAERLTMYDAIVRYGLFGEIPNIQGTLRGFFALMKPSLDSAQEKYQRSVENGKKGGRPKNNLTETQQKPSDNLTETQQKPSDNLTETQQKPSDNLTIAIDIATANDIAIASATEENQSTLMCSKAVELLNELSGSSFRSNTKATQRLIAAREKDGYCLEDIELVIRHQCKLWGNEEKMRKYLRPETLFGNKFEGYLCDARRNEPRKEAGYILAPLEDPWDAAMRGGNCG